jgi:integrase
MGEARALQWDDVDLARREIRIARAISGGKVDTPKSGHGRTIDMSAQLADILRRRSLQRGRAPWVFQSEAGTLLDHHNVAKRFRRLLRDAKLPTHFHLHCLRHTFASLLLADGVSPAYVQEQLGHASIELTVGTYGRWLRKKAPGAVDALEESAASTATAVGADGVVANPAENGSSSESDSPRSLPQVVVTGVLEAGDPGRARTFNPEIKETPRGYLTRPHTT